MLADPTQKLLQELPQARNLRDLCLILAHYTRALPFSRVAFDLDVQHSLLPVDENGELLGVELGWSPEFIRRWVESGYNLACPLVTPCKLRRWPTDHQRPERGGRALWHYRSRSSAGRPHRLRELGQRGAAGRDPALGAPL